MTPGPATAVGSVESARAFTRAAFDRRSENLSSDTDVLTSDVALADRPLFVALIVLAWMGIGFLGAVLMARRGHDFRPLAALGVVLGPLFAGLVVANLRPREQGAEAVQIRPAGELGGDQRVAVLALRDPAHVESVRTLLSEMGSSVGQVNILRPISFELADGSGEQADRERVLAELEQAGELLADYRPGLMLLPGKTPLSLSSHIEEARPDLVLVVGDPSLETKLDDRTSTRVRVLSVPA